MNWIEHRIKQAQQGGTEIDLSIDSISSGIGVKDVLTEVPPAILGLKHLIKLNLSGHRINTLPSDFQRLENLRELSLRFNFALHLDRNSPLPSQLSRLDVAFVKLADFPFERLEHLTALDISGCKVDYIPSGILSLSSLKSLDIRGNPIRSFPREFCHLSHLRSLHLGDEKANLSARDIALITEINSLLELGLHGFVTQTEVLSKISELCGLQSLELRRCTLKEIPHTWGRLQDLTDLSLEQSIDEFYVPDVSGIQEIGLFTQLQRLHLERISVTALLPYISALRDLKSMEIWHTYLAGFPVEILNCEYLENLTLVGTKVKSCPNDIRVLQNLRALNLSENALRSMPEELGEIEQLEVLWLRSNHLTNLPHNFGRLRNLKKVSLSRNELQHWPAELLELHELRVLDLSSCDLAEIPTTIWRLKNLVSLNLSGGKITTIPEEIGRLQALKELNVSGNPIHSPQPEVVAGGTAAIQEYFSALLESLSTRLFEAKLIIVGAGEVGKTCLARKLVDQDFDIEKNRETIETTRGIDIREWHTETVVSKDFKVNLWDFGGQEIYHATHQFFLTKRSLYVFVWDARKEDHIQGMDYWLNVIKLLSDSSPVLVVLNKADIRVREIDQTSLKDKFENISGFYKVSALTGQGIPELVREVRRQIANLPHIGDTWPGKWSRVRSILEADSRNYIDWDEYTRICSENELDGSQADTLSFYLHNLGVILHFREDPVLQKIVVLKPEWGTNAVYAVLDTKKIQDNNGKFSFDDLAEIWGRTIYPRSRHAELLHLMKRFELCFQLGETGYYIAPELLPEPHPKFEWDNSDTLHFEYHYQFMPAGIITRFIARNHAQIEGGCYWRNGVLLRVWEDTRAMVVAEPLNRKIRISVAGMEPKEVLAIVRHDLEFIHRTLNNLEVKQMVPCICEKCGTGPDPFLFEYRRLRGYLENGIGDIPCERSWRRVSVERLLAGVFLKPELDNPASPAVNVYMGPVEQHYHSGGGVGMAKPKKTEPRAHGPWFSGSFFLTTLVVLLVLLAAIAKYVSWWALPSVIIGGLLGVTLIGAFQLKQDERLSQQNFLKLMALAFRQLPLLKKATVEEGASSK